MQDVLGLIPLGHVVGIQQLRIPTPQGHALDDEALTLQRQDFTAYEAMADLRVLIDEIRNAHRDPTECVFD